jgi:hypothetical protein
MALHDIFSKRKARQAKTEPDVFQYDVIPAALRFQIEQVWIESIGGYGDSAASRAYGQIIEILRREWAVRTLSPSGGSFWTEIISRFQSERETDRVLDIIELCFLTIDKEVRNRPAHGSGKSADIVANEAIDEINGRFREHSIGYQYADGILIRIDSELTHKEIIKPALAVLRGKIYETAQDEFLNAHEHYRKCEYDDALIDCCKAFESTMKIICTKRNWKVDKNATAKPLVKTCLDNGLIPPFWQTHFSGLTNVLESGIPTPRNKLGGHGAGTTPTQVPEELVRYVLNMTASTILFLTEAEKKLP